MPDPLTETQLGGLVALLACTTTHREIAPHVLSAVDELRAARLELVALRAKLLEAQHDARRFKLNHLDACTTIAQMHDAAMGESGAGARRGVVEDVQDLFQANVTLKEALEFWKIVSRQAVDRWNAAERELTRERALAAAR